MPCTLQLPLSSQYDFKRVVTQATRLGLDAAGMGIILGLREEQKGSNYRIVYANGEKLAKRAGIGLRTFWRRLRQVEACGAVHIEHGGGRGKLASGQFGGFANGYMVNAEFITAMVKGHRHRPTGAIPQAPRETLAAAWERLENRKRAETAARGTGRPP